MSSELSKENWEIREPWCKGTAFQKEVLNRVHGRDNDIANGLGQKEVQHTLGSQLRS